MYWAEYLADTRRLSTLEHGAYMLLIADYWQSGEPLPDNDAVLAKVAGLTKGKWASIRSAIAGFFEVANGLWRHSRIDRELESAKQRYERRSSAGQKGGVAKSVNNSSNATAKPEQCTTQVQSTENSLQKTERKVEVDQILLASVQTLKNKKTWTREQIKAAWQSKICNEAQRRLPPEEYADFLTRWADGEPKAQSYANAIDREIRARAS